MAFHESQMHFSKCPLGAVHTVHDNRSPVLSCGLVWLSLLGWALCGTGTLGVCQSTGQRQNAGFPRDVIVFFFYQNWVVLLC